MRTFLKFVAAVAFLGAALYIAYPHLPKVISNITNGLKNLENLPIIQEIKKEVNLGGPLRSEANAPDAFLTLDGVVEWTNHRRLEHGLPQLTVNQTLNTSANIKVQDMFQDQYFAHDAPDGTRPAEVISGAGYEYITTGENLALGNFADDEELVQAWMDSPGHRENILNPKYTEIGVSVMQSVYEGRTVWMAVQHFGKPLSDCPTVNQSLKSQLENKENQADSLFGDLQRRKQELEQMETDSHEKRNEYNQKAEEYNKLVEEYNRLVEEIKQLANNYNQQVNAFNSCAST